ncbi:hypothetical protein A6E14_08945 [Vibrio genomosp. F10]|uniref:PRD domain-containing protein n=1 Tax=Vibrio genomosp. F10 TaxID=723171 RepID=A0A1B9R076_9VIBR|nr:hypothetical protein A6E14_08945 [Vibrio genomosp. F10]
MDLGTNMEQLGASMEQRFALLLQANAISQRAHNGGLQALALIDKELGLPHDNEQYQMALTHLCRAADRIWQGDAIKEGLDSEVLDEIYEDSDVDIVLNLHSKVLSSMDLNAVPTAEESFMIANIYSLYQVGKTLQNQE